MRYALNATGTLYDQAVREARQRDPQARLVGVHINAVRVERSDFATVSFYLYAPLEDTVLSYEATIAASDGPPVPGLSPRIDVHFDRSGAVPTKEAYGLLGEYLGLVPALRDIKLWPEPWNSAAWRYGFAKAYELAGSPTSFQLYGDAGARDPYDVRIYVLDLPGGPMPQRDLAEIVVSNRAYYARPVR